MIVTEPVVESSFKGRAGGWLASFLSCSKKVLGCRFYKALKKVTMFFEFFRECVYIMHIII